jgi:hypothetical protein
MISELGVWLTRIVAFLPELIGLWEAAKRPDPKDQLNASMALVRRMKDAQMAEELRGK